MGRGAVKSHLKTGEKKKIKLDVVIINPPSLSNHLLKGIIKLTPVTVGANSKAKSCF